MEIFKHIIRTLVLVILCAFTFLGVLLLLLFLRVHVYAIFASMAFLVLAVIYGTARWHPYWAPIAKRVARIPWRRDDGTDMESLIEIAIVQAGTFRNGVYRVSIYECQSRKRIARRLIGDEVTYLGSFRSGIWFYIHDRFYSRCDGLVCVDLRTGVWRYHEAKAIIEFVDEVRTLSGLIDVVWNGVSMRLDLRNDPPSLNA